MNTKLTNIVEQFAFEGTICEINPLGEGLINDTYKVKTCETGRPDYVLQRINHQVFPDIGMVMHNIDAVTSHIRNTLAAKETLDIDRRVLRFLPTKNDGNLYTMLNDGTYWRMMVFIDNAITKQNIDRENTREAGRAIGNFQKLLADIPVHLGESIKESFANLGKRFTFGGEIPKDQRVYYFNTKEIVGNKFGTPTPVPFRVVDERAGIDIDISVRCFGEYSYRLSDPILFYTNVCGNVSTEYTRNNLDSQLKSELLTALQPAFAKISGMGIRYSALPGHTFEMADALNEVLSEKWSGLRGIEIVSFGVSNVNASPEDEAMIKALQKTAVFRNANMAGAYMVGAQGEAMKRAASNPNGAMMGFMGMGMAQQAGGVNAAQLFQMGQQQQQQHAYESFLHKVSPVFLMQHIMLRSLC